MMDNLIFPTTCWDILAQTLYVLLNTVIKKTLLLQKEVMLSCFILLLGYIAPIKFFLPCDHGQDSQRRQCSRDTRRRSQKRVQRRRPAGGW